MGDPSRCVKCGFEKSNHCKGGSCQAPYMTSPTSAFPEGRFGCCGDYQEPARLTFYGTMECGGDGRWTVNVRTSNGEPSAAIVNHLREACAFVAQRLNAAHPAAKEGQSHANPHPLHTG